MLFAALGAYIGAKKYKTPGAAAGGAAIGVLVGNLALIAITGAFAASSGQMEGFGRDPSRNFLIA